MNTMEDTIRSILKREGGAVGVSTIVEETGMGEDYIRGLIQDMNGLRFHRDGDLIEIEGIEMFREYSHCRAELDNWNTHLIKRFSGDMNAAKNIDTAAVELIKCIAEVTR